MHITELIAKLEHVRATHGDLPVVTSGFDEGGFDYVEALDIVKIVPIKQYSHGPEFEDAETRDGIGPPFQALFIDRA